jgi:hypothetical protein
MAYSNPAFGLIHRLRELDPSVITSKNGITNTQKAYLSDGRREPFTFDGSASDHWLRWDMGATPAATDRLVILDGHNLDGNTITYKAADSSDMLTNPTTLINGVSVSAGMIDEAFDGGENAQQYGELSFGGTGTWELPEVWVTKRRTMTKGPAWPWRDSWRYNVLDMVKPSGSIATLELGAKQRDFRVDWKKVYLAADLAVFDDLFDDIGRTNPWLWWPPYGEPPLMVHLMRDPARQPGARNPATVEAQNITLEFLELTA